MKNAKGKKTSIRKGSTQLTPATTMKPEKEICFVIMPFGGWSDSYYQSIYCPAIESAGLEPHRADDLFRPSTIVNDIWAYTKLAKLLLADLTGKNPNVFYELGLAHALAKPVILIAESMDDIPFDLRALRIIPYDKNAPDWGAALAEKIKNAVTEVLSSPAEAVLPAFLDVKSAGTKPAVSAEKKEIIEIKQDIDLLRREFARYSSSEVAESSGKRRTINAKEAIALLENMLRGGLPDAEIIDTLTSLGAPRNWIRSTINEERERIEKTVSNRSDDPKGT